MTQPESRTVEERHLTREEAIEKALLFTFQLSNIDYRKMQAAMSETVFIRALEQDGYTVVPTAVKEHGLVIGEGELDVAWKEAEAALPEGWRIVGLRGPKRWVASAEPTPANKRHGSGVLWLGRGAEGDTPVAALRALAERLRR